MLWIGDLATWLQQRWPGEHEGLTVPLPDEWHRGDEELPAMPDRVIGLTVSGGPGLEADGLLDTLAFTVLARGRGTLPGDDHTQRALSAEALAQAADLAVLADGPHELIGHRTVSRIGRMGGAPSYLRRERSRTLVSCRYWITVDRPQPARALPRR